MSKDTQSKLISILISFLIAILAIFGYNVVIVQPQLAALEGQAGPAFAGAVGDTNFTNVVAEDITATDDLVVTDAATIGDLALSENLVVAAPTAIATTTPAAVINSVGVSPLFEVRDSATPVARIANGGGFDLLVGQLDLPAYLNLSAQTTVVVSAGSIITATGTYQPLSSASSVTTSTSTAIADGSESGDLLIVRNVNASDTITIDGAGANVECNGNITLGANDVLTLIWNGSDWSCVALRDNSA